MSKNTYVKTNLKKSAVNLSFVSTILFILLIVDNGLPKSFLECLLYIILPSIFYSFLLLISYVYLLIKLRRYND